VAFLENCVERLTVLAATCGWLALGAGGTEAAVGVVIGGVGLATAVSETARRHGPESEAALRSIRKRITADLLKYAEVERWDTRPDIKAADASMERALAGCFLDRKALATSARSAEGFPGSATKLILAQLAEHEPATFGKDGPTVARHFAEMVVHIALEAAIENESYFKSLQPHLLVEMLRGLGSVEEKLEKGFQEVRNQNKETNKLIKEMHDIVLDNNRSANTKINKFAIHVKPSIPQRSTGLEIFRVISLDGLTAHKLFCDKIASQSGITKEKIAKQKIMISTEEYCYYGEPKHLWIDCSPEASYVLLKNKVKLRIDYEHIKLVANDLFSDLFNLDSNIFEPVEVRFSFKENKGVNETELSPIGDFIVDFLYCIDFDKVEIDEVRAIEILMILIFQSWIDWELIWGNYTTALSNGFVAKKLLKKIDLTKNLSEISRQIKHFSRPVQVDDRYFTLNSFCLHIRKVSSLFSKAALIEFAEAIDIHRENLSVVVNEFINKHKMSS
jgi:hypothetical protein